ncbi:hypothetical protein G7046_g8685 [Stylonectria norvegica]|nr:hypothetical protein G7046_g8685 [Stylonectria norvegica]
MTPGGEQGGIMVVDNAALQPANAKASWCCEKKKEAVVGVRIIAHSDPLHRRLAGLSSQGKRTVVIPANSPCGRSMAMPVAVILSWTTDDDGARPTTNQTNLSSLCDTTLETHDLLDRATAGRTTAGLAKSALVDRARRDHHQPFRGLRAIMQRAAHRPCTDRSAGGLLAIPRSLIDREVLRAGERGASRDGSACNAALLMMHFASEWKPEMHGDSDTKQVAVSNQASGQQM